MGSSGFCRRLSVTQVSMLCQTMLRVAARRSTPTALVRAPVLRSFGALTTGHGKGATAINVGDDVGIADRIYLANHVDKNAVRPFVGASRSEPTMDYVEEPSMLY